MHRNSCESKSPEISVANMVNARLREHDGKNTPNPE